MFINDTFLPEGMSKQIY